MPDISYLSLTGASVEATAAQARMANAVCRLFKSGFVPSPLSTKEDFEAVECDFDGYAPATIATWHAPVLAGTGYMTYAPAQTFPWTHDTDDVGNAVGGYWIETAGGDLISYTVFNPARPAQGPGQAVIVTPVLVFPAG